MARVIGIMILGFNLMACASGSRGTASYWPDISDDNQAEGEAFTGHGMFYRKAMPSRPDWRPSEFYVKKCSEIGEESFYSKTSYECSPF